MNNKLFLICPDCHLEYFIRKKYGENVFFLTALGAVFNFSEVNYTEAILDFISNESISEIVVVNDCSCRFIKSVVEAEGGFDTSCEDVIRDILIDNYPAIMHDRSMVEKKKQLAKLIVDRQVNEIMTNELFLRRIRLQNVRITGLVLSINKQVLKAY